jgi:hypothetical protein
MKFKSDIEVQAGLKDSSGANGTSGQVLSSNGTTVSWINAGSLTASDVQNQVKAGVAINKGQAVYVTGADGTNIIVGLASNTTEATSSKTLGLLNATVAVNGFADVIQIGKLSGLNTIGAVVGDPVWLGTNGNLIYGLANKPYAPAHLVYIGVVTRVNANNGEIFVTVQNGFELKEIHDVDIITTPPVNGDVLGYNGTLWVNKTIPGWLGYTPVTEARTITINGTTQDLSANRTWSVGTVTSVAALTLGTSGTDLSSTVATGTTTPVITLNVPTASAANRGALSSTDWSTFNTKVGSVTASSPLASSGGSTPNITIQQASGSQNGYLSSTDWTTFNSKQASGNYITSLTGEATASGPGAAAVTLNNASVTGKLLTGVNITGGTVQATDTMLTAFGKLQNQINGLIGSSIYQGTWNASTNTPALTSSVGTRGYYYIVNVAGTTNLNGITDWFVGDWVIFDGTAWQQVDNTDAVVSVNGQTGAVSLTTDNISEGSTNLYYLNSRARSALSFTAGSGAYNSTTGVITIPTNTNQLTNGSNYITLASLSGTAPIGYNNTTGAISITQAGTASNGYLSSTDWNTFNNKTSNTGTVTSVSGTGGYGGLTLSGTVTTSGSLTLGGTPTGTWPISVSGNAATATNATYANSAGTTSSVSTSYIATNADHYITFVDSNNGSPTAETVYTVGTLRYNPYTGNLNANNFIATATESREVSTYLPSSYTTNDLVSGTNYKWYSDIWRLGATRSGGAAAADFVVQLNGVNKLNLTVGGSLSVTGDMRSPIFYDTNNTGYYVDPASTSNLNAVNFSTLYSNRSGASGNVITIDNAGSSTWPFIFQTSAVGNDNSSGFWTSSLGYPDMRLRKDDGTVRALISSWERSYTTYGLSDDTDMRAPIFYDSNNTGYYVDPAASSTIYQSNYAVGSYLGSYRWKVFPQDNGGGIDLYMQGTNSIDAVTAYLQMSIVSSRGFYWSGGKAEFSQDVRTPIFYDSNNTGYYCDPASTSNLNIVRAANSLTGAWIGVENSSNTSGNGISLYGGASSGQPSYGLMFAGTATFGTHGSVTSDWATYFTMNDDSSRGWIFKRGTTNVASISGGGFANFNGDVTAYYSSDRRLKDNITPIGNALDKVKKIGGYTFDWNDKQQAHTGHDVGIIAQEIEAVLPEVVTTRDTGFKAVKYEKIVPLLIEAIKEQQTQIEELKELVNKLINK